MRIKGSTLQEIADAFGKSKQSISYLFRIFPVPDKETVFPALPSSVTADAAVQMCQLCISGSSVTEITELMDCSEKEVYGVFGFLRFKKDKRKENKNTCYYPNVLKWILDHGVQNKTFSRQLGMSATTLRLMMYGYMYLPLNTAQKIKEITSLSLKEIYSEFYPKWTAEIKS